MAFKTSLTSVRYYTEADPYVFSVDNRPLSDLDANIQAVADRADAISIGRIDISGAVTPITNNLPATWTVTRNGVGDYTITHNLNKAATAYSVQITCYHSTTPHIGFVYDMQLNNFSIKTVTMASAAADVRFMITLTSAG